MNKIGLFRNITLLCALVLISINLSAHDDDDYDYGSPPNSLPEWEKIQLPTEDWVRDPNNPDLTRTIHPGCAFTYQTGEPYQFYYKAGDKDKLLIYFNGGGACWNDHTCITSLKIGDRPTYNPSLAEENDPVIAAGILDTNNSKNPFKDWSMIFLPYCTGDIHIGSKDSVYSDLTGAVTGVPGTPVAIQHKGFDNVLGVKKWIRKNLKNRRGTSSMDKILLAGSSAGGYGAVFNFAHIKNTFRKAEVNLISDSSANILTQNFLDEVFTDGGTWGIENNISLSIPGFDNFGNLDANVLNETFFGGLASYFPESQFGQFTPAWDAVQVSFLKIMKNPDNPEKWADLDVATFCEWNSRMTQSLSSTASNSNYRHYIGQGTIHVGLVDAFAPNRFYSEISGGEALPKWVQRITKSDDDEWLNRECTNCAAPFPAELCQTL